MRSNIQMEPTLLARSRVPASAAHLVRSADNHDTIPEDLTEYIHTSRL